MRSFEAFGGHSETKGLSTDGQVIQISPHHHSVSLRFLHFNMGLRYQLNPKLALSLAIPYTIKEQTARVEWPDHHPTRSEREASQRNGDIHHRNETYTGLNDLSLLVTYKLASLLRTNDRLTLSAGLSLPTGKTEPDPWKLGDVGQKHLHLQFGTGTVIPMLECRYWLPITKSIVLQTTLVTRRPVYENRHKFLASADTSFFLSAVFQPIELLRVRSSWMVSRQGFGYWDGRKDSNTGLRMNALVLGTNIGQQTQLSTSLIVPIHQRMLASGDTFEHGMLLSSALSRPF